MSKIIYVGLPAHGHINPTLPIMKMLVERGHEVLYYNAELFRDKVAVTGADFRPYIEPLPTEREISEALHELIDSSRMIARISPRLTHFMLNEIAREQPDLVIYDSVAMWGYVAARVLNIPQICLITTFVLDGVVGLLGFGAIARFILSALPHIPALMKWRWQMAREFGKANAGGITEYADLNIVFTSQEFHPENSFIDSRFCFVGPSIDATTRNGDFPYDQLDPNRKKVYISLGTIYHLDSTFYHTLFEAFADYPAQFILSAGKHTDIPALGTLPENFLVFNVVPQLDILQKVDLFITHGGMNSVHEGLYYGVPEVVIPQQIEQLTNGKRVAQTQTGVLLGDDYPYGKVTVDELRNGVDTVLSTPDYKQNASRIGETLKSAGGYRRAVQIIETYLSTKIKGLTIHQPEIISR